MIEKIKYETCIEPGPFIGVPIYHVIISDSDTNTGEIADAILSVRNHKSKTNKILFTGEFVANLSNEMFTLLKTFKDYKYYTYIITDGKMYFSYYNQIDWLAVRISLDTWSAFKCHQIIFEGFKDGDPEPMVFNEGNQHPACYVKPSKGATKNGIKSFLNKASIPWNVVLPVSKVFSDIIYERSL